MAVEAEEGVTTPQTDAQEVRVVEAGTVEVQAEQEIRHPQARHKEVMVVLVALLVLAQILVLVAVAVQVPLAGLEMEQTLEPVAQEQPLLFLAHL